MTSENPALRRSLPLALVVLYGLGVTIGAGIYVLIGATAARAGVHAPLAFALAAVVMAFSAASFAEISCRFPVSAGEAAYVRAGFRSGALSLVVGLMVALAGIASSAAITVGSTGYLREFIDLPASVLVPAVVVLLALIAAWGIMESVLIAGILTLLETGVLVLIIGFGLTDDPDRLDRLPEIASAITDPAAWGPIVSGGLLAVFAFLGFEDIVNLAEEVKRPRRTLPWAILLTLTITTGLYMLIAYVAVVAVPVEELAASGAPLSLLFDRVTGLPMAIVTAVAIVATLNGVIIQMIMASRVLYGLARHGSLPASLGRVSPVTRTPLVATTVVAALVLLLAWTLPLEVLAEWTSRIVLAVFALVNAALVLIKLRGEPGPPEAVRVPLWVPAGGTLTCVGMLVSGLF